jgi:integrase
VQPAGASPFSRLDDVLAGRERDAAAHSRRRRLRRTADAIPDAPGDRRTRRALSLRCAPVSSTHRSSRGRPLGLSASTIKNTLAPLGRIMNLAARRGMVPANPISRLERSERSRKSARAPKRILDREEIGRLLAEAKGYRLMLALGLNTGLRQAEILGLRWCDIDFAEEAITVSGQLERRRNENGVKVPLRRVEYAKTEAGYRRVEPIPSDLFAAPRKHRLASAHSQDGDFVFATRYGSPIDHKDASTRGLAGAKGRAKLDVPGKPSLRFHDLRHTFASACIAAGVDVAYLSRQLGHNDPSVTLDVYADLFEAREKAAASRKLLQASGYSGLI